MEQSFAGWKRYALVQPPIMMLLLAESMSGNILTDLIVFRTCSITLGINKTECMLLHQNSSSAEALVIEGQVQPHASLIIMSKSFVSSILPAFLSLFLGPWSDKYGRKPLILSGYIGSSLTFLILSIVADYDISPWMLLIAYIPSAILGGFCILMLATICYVADITNDDNRAWHLAWLDALIMLGFLLGIFAGPAVFSKFGYSVVFSCSTLCCVLAGLYVCFYVPETIINLNRITLASLFDVSLVKDLVSTCTKKRDGFDRRIVWCCIACLTLLIVNMQGQSSIGFLFTSAKFGWNVNTYSVYMGACIALSIFGTIAGVTAMKNYAKFSEVVISMLAVLSSLCGVLTQAFAWKPWHMYLSTVISMFGGAACPTVRSILSKSVPSEDAGKVFSLATSIETLTPFEATSLFGMIYSYYMPPLYPLPVWLVAAAIFAIVILLLINIRVRQSRINDPDRAPLTQNTEECS